MTYFKNQHMTPKDRNNYEDQNTDERNVFKISESLNGISAPYFLDKTQSMTYG
jgi:hypothetical protein